LIADRLSGRFAQAAVVALPALLGVAVLLIMAALGEGASGGRTFLHDAGFTSLTWYPCALFLLGLLAVVAYGLPIRLRDVPRPVLAAAGLLAAYTAWSFLSILWADAQGEAWDGANRTLLYLIVFCLFALRPQRAETAATVLAAWTLVMAVFGAVVLVRMGDGAGAAKFIGNRLADPAGYPNAAAAAFFMPVWPAVVLAGRGELAWWLRGALAGAAVLLADLVLLTQSRGAVYALPIVLLLLFVLVPDRARTFLVLLPMAAAVGITAPTLLDVNDRLLHHTASSAGDAVAPVVIAAGAVAILVAALALLGRHAPIPAGARRATGRAIGALGIASAVAVLVAGLVAVGDPVARAQHEWKSFKGDYKTIPAGESRLSTGLGSNRYDFYRVALDGFTAHPAAGLGIDNFGQLYLLERKSSETPRYPHSLELRALSQTGLVGALLLAGAFAAALVAAVRAMRRGAGRLAGAVAGGATVAFLYWLVHGSFDWFWEFASLGGAAFAMLGLACALLPREDAAAATAGNGRRPRVPRSVALALVAIAMLAAATTLALPWLAERDVRAATSEWPIDARGAYDRLDRAAELNPLSDRPSLILGSIALRLGDLDHARHGFLAALERNPRGEYAAFELGLIASEQGHSAAAQRYFREALARNPHDRLAREALDRVRRGKPLSIDEANQQILRDARALSR
jgi:O-antigen ligase